MKILVQRSKYSSVSVNNKIVGEIIAMIKEIKDEGINHRRRSSRDQSCGQTETGRQRPGYHDPDQGQGYFLRRLRSSLLCGRPY